MRALHHRGITRAPPLPNSGKKWSLATNNITPSIKLRAVEEYKKPLALAGGANGGPLVPVYERHFATDVVEEDEEELPPEEVVEFSLYNSIWGPRAGA